jgi:DNA-binding transcriptional MerR regulator
VFSIGEFSRITGLSVKALRFYHDKGVLIPSRVDRHSGYRYYDESNIERARIVTRLRSLEFSLDEIREILEGYDDEADILGYLQRQKQLIETKIRKHRAVARSLDRILSQEREAKTAMEDSNFEVEEKTLDTMLIAGVRIKGKYSECGRGFALIGKTLGRYTYGKPMCLHYDAEYREDDADFEACVPIRKGKEAEGISVRELPGGRCICILHKGPYEELGRSYAKILAHAREKGHEIRLPTREVYIKGPGMILKGNPKNYLTEIQMLLE